MKQLYFIFLGISCLSFSCVLIAMESAPTKNDIQNWSSFTEDNPTRDDSTIEEESPRQSSLRKSSTPEDVEHFIQQTSPPSPVMKREEFVQFLNFSAQRLGSQYDLKGCSAIIENMSSEQYGNLLALLPPKEEMKDLKDSRRASLRLSGIMNFIEESSKPTGKEESHETPALKATTQEKQGTIMDLHEQFSSSSDQEESHEMEELQVVASQENQGAINSQSERINEIEHDRTSQTSEQEVNTTQGDQAVIDKICSKYWKYIGIGTGTIFIAAIALIIYFTVTRTSN